MAFSPLNQRRFIFYLVRGLNFHLSADQANWGSPRSSVQYTSSRSKFEICALWHSFYFPHLPDWFLCL